MAQQASFTINTTGRDTYELTNLIRQFVIDSKVTTGLCNIFCQHTSASLILCENADPDVQRDLSVFMDALVPDGDSRFIHVAEGDDDMPAHIRSALTTNSMSIPVTNNSLALGVWQGIFLWEHRRASQHRKIVITLTG